MDGIHDTGNNYLGCRKYVYPWLGERITDKGVGNGISLIIMIGIIARLPQAFVQEVASRLQAISGGGLIMFIVEILILML